MIEIDIEKAREAGVRAEVIDEYRRLRKSIDINKRLLRLLESTYKMSEEKVKMGDEAGLAIRSMNMNVRFQEERLEQIRKEFIAEAKPA